MVSKASLCLPLSLSCLVGSFVIQNEAVASVQENLPNVVGPNEMTVVPQKVMEKDSEPVAAQKESEPVEKKVQFDVFQQDDSDEGDLSSTLTQSVRPKSKGVINAPKSNLPRRMPSRTLSTTISRTESSCSQNPQNSGSSPSE